MDRLPEDRLEHALKASGNMRKYTDSQIEEIKLFYSNDKSYKNTMEKFGITSKGSLHFILNNTYITKSPK
jgi:hypothetical protein